MLKTKEFEDIHFPKMYLKTPMIEESLSLKDGVYLVNSRIEICVYQKAKDNYCSVITKDILFANGQWETILLKYINNIKNYDDVLDLTDEFMESIK